MKYDFVEIGTCDFDTLVQNSGNQAKGICIDILKSYLDKLPNLPGVIKLDCAISDSPGKDLFYYVESDDVISHNLPEWTKGCGRLGNPHPFLVQELERRDLYNLLKVMQVEKIQISTILEKYLVSQLGILKLDLGGHDVAVLKSFLDYGKVLPDKIIFEFIPEISDSILLSECQEKLKDLGYVLTWDHFSNLTYERKFRKDGKPRIMVVTTFDENYSEMAKMTAGQNFEIYCALNNYALHKDYMGKDFERAPQWRKISLLTELIRQDAADWFFFIDCDCLFMNFSQNLESFIDDSFSIIGTRTGGAPDNPLAGAYSENAFMSAQLLVKSSETSLAILQEIWESPDWPEGISINDFDHEMRQMRFTFNKPQWKSQINIISQKHFNRFWPSENPHFVLAFPEHNKNCWEPGDFIVHVVGRAKEERMKIIYDLQVFSGGVLTKWGKNENRIFFESLIDLENIIIFAVGSSGETICHWNFESLKRGTSYWISREENVEHEVQFWSYQNQDLTKPISAYKFFTNPEFL